MRQPALSKASIPPSRCHGGHDRIGLRATFRNEQSRPPPASRTRTPVSALGPYAAASRITPMTERHPDLFKVLIGVETVFGATGQATNLGAILMIGDALFFSIRQRIAELSLNHQLPLIVDGPREYVLAGALMTYGANASDLFRRSATYVDKILKGAKPGDLPIEQPIKFDFVVNLKTAQALGLQIPDKMLAIADEVIE